MLSKSKELVVKVFVTYLAGDWFWTGCLEVRNFDGDRKILYFLNHILFRGQQDWTKFYRFLSNCFDPKGFRVFRVIRFLTFLEKFLEQTKYEKIKSIQLWGTIQFELGGQRRTWSHWETGSWVGIQNLAVSVQFREDSVSETRYLYRPQDILKHFQMPRFDFWTNKQSQHLTISNISKFKIDLWFVSLSFAVIFTIPLLIT